MTDVDLSNQKAGLAWFESFSFETKCALASRAALRVFPNIARVDDPVWADIAVSALHPSLVCVVRSLADGSQEELLTQAARDARQTALSTFSSFQYSHAFDAAAGSALYASLTAADTAHIAQHSSQSAWETIRNSDRSEKSAAAFLFGADKRHPKNPESQNSIATRLDAENPKALKHELSLWSELDTPTAILTNHNSMLARLADDPSLAFWHEWYAGMWDGKFRDWERAFRVAENRDLAQQTRRTPSDTSISDQERLDKTAIGPGLVQVSEDRWDVEADEDVPSESIEFSIAQVETVYTAALSTESNNSFNENSPEARIISDALSRYRNRPSEVATAFWNACMILEKNIDSLYPKSPTLVALKNTLFTSIGEITSQNDLVRTRVQRLAELTPRRPPTIQEKEDLKQVPEVAREHLEPKAHEELEKMVAEVISNDQPALFWRVRLVNWLTTLGLNIDRAKKNYLRGEWLLDVVRRISSWFFEDDDKNPK